MLLSVHNFRVRVSAAAKGAAFAPQTSSASARFARLPTLFDRAGDRREFSVKDVTAIGLAATRSTKNSQQIGFMKMEHSLQVRSQIAKRGFIAWNVDG